MINRLDSLTKDLYSNFMIQQKQFFLNGETYTIDKDISLSDLLIYFNYNDSLLVLEHNNLICEKKGWKKIFIQDSDRIEIVTIVGGG
jgi:sulfur carrier protein